MQDARPERATRARYVVLSLTLALAAVVYLDRVCISTTAGAIKTELGLDDSQLGWVFSVFTLAYAAFEVPSGWLADRFGSRAMLTRIVVAWSLMTAATGAAVGFHSLLLVRLLFGLGEAGAFPAIARAYGRWLPPQQRGAAFGAAVMAGLLGAAVTQPLVVALLGVMRWRLIFPLFGVVGLLWATVWFLWFRDDPHRHPGVNALELLKIGGVPEPPRRPVPWRALLRNRSLIALCLMYLGAIYGWYFYITWLPQYLLRARGFDMKSVGWLAALPLLAIALGVLTGGWASDLLVPRLGARWGRRLPGLVGLPLAAVAVMVAVSTPTPWIAVLGLISAAGLAALGVAPAWATCLDIGGAHAGVVSGAMNTFGNLGGALSPLVVGVCLKQWASWEAPLLTVAGLYFFAALCWARIDSTDTLPAAS
jgi:ACS family glucarate transporter-like MFS transporter